MRKQNDASLTVEAAISVPIFFFTMLTLCYLLRLAELQIMMQGAMNTAAERAASYGYLYNRLSAETESLLEGKVEELLSSVKLLSDDDSSLLAEGAGSFAENLFSSLGGKMILKLLTLSCMDADESLAGMIEGGVMAADFEGSFLRDESNCIVITAAYKVKIPFAPDFLPSIRVQQTSVQRLFCGDRDYVPKERTKEGETEDEGTVYYVTPNGSVYHCSRDCSYLNISVQCGSRESIQTKRNKSGGKYYPCSLCGDTNALDELLYYTEEGSCYHTTRNCRSLKRTVIEKSENEIVGLPACSRCKTSQIK